MSEKTHAKDYLKEFSNDKPEWLKILIKEAIETNGVISDTRKDEIFDSLLDNKKLQVQFIQSASNQQTSEKLLLDSLTHTSGVNALCENQTIKFSPNVTVLYGLNGSGKSSYFRILNNISGGTQKNIFPNIYMADSDKKPLNVSIEYKIGNNNKSHKCNGSISVQSDFHGVKVFDSSYLNGLLRPKSLDEAIIYPLGLHLFKYITETMDSFASRLNQLVTQKLQELPVIKTDNLSDNIKNKFNNYESFNANERNNIKTKFDFSEGKKKELVQKEGELEQLQQTNYQDRIALLTKENIAFSSFTAQIDNAIKNLKDYSEKLKKAFDVYSVAKIKNDKARKQSEIITKLPNSDTLEWKAFIKAGQEYVSRLEKEETAKCPYCHQKLKSEEAISIIKAYANFLNDTSESELSAAEKKIRDIKEEIGNLNLSITISDEVKTLITDIADLKNKIEQFSICKTTLLGAKESMNIPAITLDFSRELKILGDKQKENKTNLTELTSTKEEKDKKIVELQKNIAELKENKSISEQKLNIEKYFSIYECKDKIESKKRETRTTELTKTSNLAQNSLLTDTLKTRFKKELKELGKNNLEVKLEVTNGSKGKSQTQLKLVGNNSVQNILSEGEQKAVGLAMFFAEIQVGNYPIILDDPVTSLDHEIAGNLAKRLLDFDNQIIVFCHSRLFLDGFETSRKNHICKNFASCSCAPEKGKHTFIYQVYGDGKEKGILSNYKGDNSDSIIREVNSRLNKRPFSDNYGVSILLRRAVEKIIDEDVFKYQLPPRVSNKNSRVNWGELKNINSRPDLIERLRSVYNDVSEEDHDGTASLENPITVDKLRELSDELSKIKSEFKNGSVTADME